MPYDLIIIGGGPAGITAAVYASRQRMNTLLLTKDFGGQMAKKATEVCNYPGFPRISGPELIDLFVKQLKEQELVETKITEVIKVEKRENMFFVKTEENKEFSAKAVIVATGADPRPLEAIGEKEFIGKGVGYCVTCDGPLFKKKTVAVIGGGNAGLEASLFMADYASKVYILEYGAAIKADFQNKEDVKKRGNIEIITSAAVKEFKGDGFLNSLTYQDLQSNKLKVLELQGAFIEIGSEPATSMVKDLVEFNERDEIKTDSETFQTKTKGLFAVGDVNAGKYKQIVTAAGEGCKGALAVYEYLKRNG